MPKSHTRKGHRHRVEVRNQKIKEHRRRVENMYAQMYEELRKYNTSVPDMLNKEESENQEIDLRSVKPLEEIIDGYSVVDLPETDPNEPVSIVSQWPADMQIPEVETTLTTASS